MHRRFSLLVVSLWLAVVHVRALYSRSEHVTMLDYTNFKRLVLESDSASIVEFYAPWCGHCQSFSPQYKKVAETLQGAVLVGAVDCDIDLNRELCAQYQVTHLPTVKLFGPGKEKNPYTGEQTKEPTTYKGQLSGKGLADAASALLPDDHIQYITSLDDLSAFKSASADVPKVLLVSTKREASTIYRGLSHKLHRFLNFGLVAKESEEVVQALDVARVPELLVFKADGSVVRYPGEMKPAALSKFLSTFLPEGVDLNALAGLAHLPLLPLSGLDALDLVEDMHLLAFYSEAGRGCKPELVVLSDVVKSLGGVVNVSVVELKEAQEEKVVKYGVDLEDLHASPCSPQLVLLPFGEEKSVNSDEYLRYPGPLEGEGLLKWLMGTMPRMVTVLNARNMDEFMGLRGEDAEPEDSPKVLLFQNSSVVPEVYNALAVNMRHSAITAFGFVQGNDKSNADIMKQFNVPSDPYLCVLMPYDGDDMPVDAPGEARPMSVQSYAGPVQYDAMQRWLTITTRVLDARVQAKKAHGTMVPKANSTADLQQLCPVSLGWCLIAVMDGSGADHFHSDQIRLLFRLGSQVTATGQKLGVLWVDASAHPTVLPQIGIDARTVPTAVLIHMGRMTWAHLGIVGFSGITEAKLTKFLSGVLSRKIQTQPLEKLPVFPAPPEEPEPVEVIKEEFDLSDVMAEEVDPAMIKSKAEKIQDVEAEMEARRKLEEEQQKAKKTKKKAKKKSKKSAEKAEL